MAREQMKNSTRPVAVLGGIRLPFCRIGTAYHDLSTLDLLIENMKVIVERFDLKGQRLGEVALGTVFYHPSVWNLAREAVLQIGLSNETPAVGIQRACATSLDAAILIGNKIATGQIEVGIAGGAESMSDIAVFYRKGLAQRLKKTIQAKKWTQRVSAWKGFNVKDLKPEIPPVVEPTTGKSMGQHCEMMAKQWQISRPEQDELSLRSHQSGAQAYGRGFYADLVSPLLGISKDNNLRDDTSLEKMAKLKPSFDFSSEGTLTAGNSSPLTDGAACVILSSEAWAKERGLEVQAHLTAYETAAIDLRSEGLLMAPTYAVSRMLERIGLSLQQFDFYEIHEAFAAQVLCTLKAWESDEFCKKRLRRNAPLGSLDRNKLNVVGGSVALGHPFGATGARLIADMGKLLTEKGTGRGLLSICTGGGMGTAAVMER